MEKEFYLFNKYRERFSTVEQIMMDELISEKGFIRKCDKCGKFMYEGYCVGGGMKYFCSDDCLHSEMSDRDFQVLYYDILADSDEYENLSDEEFQKFLEENGEDGAGDSYYTNWEGEYTQAIVDKLNSIAEEEGMDDSDDIRESMTNHINSTLIEGNLTSDPELLENGTVRFVIAVHRFDVTGKDITHECVNIQCIAEDEIAEKIMEKTKRGTSIRVLGRITVFNNSFTIFSEHVEYKRRKSSL